MGGFDGQHSESVNGQHNRITTVMNQSSSVSSIIIPLVLCHLKNAIEEARDSRRSR